VEAYQRDERTRKRIRKSYPKTILEGKQGKHLIGSNNYIEGRSYLTISLKEAQHLIDRYAGTGEIKRDRKGEWVHKEFITFDSVIGVVVDPATGEKTQTRRGAIHYSNKGTHIVPAKEAKNA
ncbi:MAG: polymorphic toxin type 50 domain-containing protein, partial [Eubacterium sp.]